MRVACIGDSLVSHCVPRNEDPDRAFRLRDSRFRMCGMPGGKVWALLSLSESDFERRFADIASFRPGIVIFAMGTNDLCSISVTPQRLCDGIVGLMGRFRSLGIHPRRFCILPILPRFSTGLPHRRWVQGTLPGFKARVAETNLLLAELGRRSALAGGNIRFWSHDSQNMRMASAYMYDGVHMTDQGKRRFIRSIRHAVLVLHRDIVRGTNSV